MRVTRPAGCLRHLSRPDRTRTEGLLADRDDNARPTYAPAPEGFSLPPLGLAERADELMPVRHLFGAKVGFPARFDAAAERLAGEGGAAVSPTQAALFFGHRLRLEIDPHRLTHRLSDHLYEADRPRRTDALFLDGGDWSRILSPLEESPVHGEILDICRTRHEFRKTSRYRWLVKQIDQGRPMGRSGVRLDTVGKLDGYYRYYLDLVESIERTGLLPRHRIGLGEHTGRSHRSIRSFWRDLIERDIGIAIGPDGALVRHTSGRHRLAAAVGLGLTRIPVEIRMVHAGWLMEQAQELSLSPTQALVAALAKMGQPATTGVSVRPPHSAQEPS